jgi:VanZ family protein
VKPVTIILLLTLAYFAKGQTIPIDKQKHFAAGVVIGGLSASYYKTKHPFWNAVLFSTVAGVSKEFVDIRIGTPDVNDALVTVAGGIVGGAIVYGVRKKIHIIKQRKQKIK